MSVLVVGGDGFLGRQVVKAVRGSGHEVDSLIRRPRPNPAEHRLLIGDARQVRLGLGEEAAAELAERTTHIIHAAGAFDVTVTLKQAQSEHIATARGAMAFAATCPGLQRITLVSSLLAVGRTGSRVVRSDDRPSPVEHRNFYEWAKWEEEAVWLRSDLPARIVRVGQLVSSLDDEVRPPSAVGMFQALPALMSGWIVPIRTDARFWCCPVDFAAALIAHATLDDDAPDALWALDPASPTYGQLLDVLAARHGLRARRLNSPRLAAVAAALNASRVAGTRTPAEIVEYTAAEWHLDLTCLDKVVGSGLDAPPDLQYLARTMDHEMARLASFS